MKVIEVAYKKVKGLPDVAVPKECNRLFRGDEESMREFLLKIINGEIRDTYGADISAAVKLKALSMWNEMNIAAAEREKNKGSTINIIVGEQGGTFNERVLSEPVSTESERESIEV
jgi:hypothetical protein